MNATSSGICFFNEFAVLSLILTRKDQQYGMLAVSFQIFKFFMKEKKKTEQSKLPLIVSGSIILILVLSYFFIPDVKAFADNAYKVLASDDEEKITNWVSQFGFWGPIIIIFGMIVQIFLLVIPSFLLMIISILAYGPVWGSIIVLIAVFSASSVGYFIGSYLGDFTVQKLLGEKTQQKIEGQVDRYGLWAVFIARISPLISNDAISLIAGLLNLSYFKFMAATMAGIFPLTILIAILGKDFDNLINGLIWISVVSVIGLVAFIIYDKNKK